MRSCRCRSRGYRRTRGSPPAAGPAASGHARPPRRGTRPRARRSVDPWAHHRAQHWHQSARVRFTRSAGPADTRVTHQPNVPVINNTPPAAMTRKRPCYPACDGWSRSIPTTRATRSRSTSRARMAARSRQATAAIMQSIRPLGVTPARRHLRWIRTAPSKSVTASKWHRWNRSRRRRRSASRASLRAPDSTSMITGSVTAIGSSAAISSEMRRSAGRPAAGSGHNLPATEQRPGCMGRRRPGNWPAEPAWSPLEGAARCITSTPMW